MIKKIAVRNEAQRILFENLQGQFSDGYWENSTMPWQDWSHAEVIVDPDNLGVEGWANRYYNLTNSEMLGYIEDSLIHEVIHGATWRGQTGTGDESYDHKRLMKDLNDLKRIQKMERDTTKPEPTKADIAFKSWLEAVKRVEAAEIALQNAQKVARDARNAYEAV